MCVCDRKQKNFLSICVYMWTICEFFKQTNKQQQNKNWSDIRIIWISSIHSTKIFFTFCFNYAHTHTHTHAVIIGGVCISSITILIHSLNHCESHSQPVNVLLLLLVYICNDNVCPALRYFLLPSSFIIYIYFIIANHSQFVPFDFMIHFLFCFKYQHRIHTYNTSMWHIRMYSNPNQQTNNHHRRQFRFLNSSFVL